MPKKMLTKYQFSPIHKKYQRKTMHNVPTDVLIAFAGIFAILQAFSMVFTNLGIPANHSEGRSTWVSPDGTVFEEFEVTEFESSQEMLHDFNEKRGETLLVSRR